MTEPNAVSASMSADTLRTFIGKRVRVLRDTRQEGIGELVEVLPGTFGVYDPENENADSDGVVTVEVEDKSLRWIDDQLGDFTASRRVSNQWALVEVE